MTYSAQFDATDGTNAVIDGGVTLLVAFVSFATIIGLVIVYKWIRKNAK